MEGEFPMLLRDAVEYADVFVAPELKFFDMIPTQMHHC
jgi:hypothetical protein